MRVLQRRLRAAVVGSSVIFFHATAGAQSVQVETFTATAMADCAMPGAAGGGIVVFSTAATLQSVDFAPGTTFFNGVPIDFDGTEPSFLASTYTGGVVTPVTAGPASVSISGTGTVGGGSHGGGCSVAGSPVPLGPGFSPSNLDVAIGPGIDLTTNVPVWTSSVLPQLNGRNVYAQGPMSVTSVDAVNGIVNFTFSGGIFAGSAAVPALTTLGFVCLVTGLCGIAVAAMSRRLRRRADA